MIKTISDNNHDMIKNIMTLYGIEQFDLDCTYSTGNFWKDIIEPKYKSDLEPVNDTIIQANSENLPFKDNSMKSIMYDPPFVIAGKTYKTNIKGSSVIAKRFSAFESFEDLKVNYYKSLKELYRILDKDGYLVFKCQDTVSGGKNYMSHRMIMNMAEDLGYHCRDFFVLTSKVRMNSMGGRWSKQIHGRKYHSFFIVFQKKKVNINYDFSYLKNEIESPTEKG